MFAPKHDIETTTTFADMLAASEEQADQSRRARRPLALRVLTWGSSQNPYRNALLKCEYLLTLPFRLVAGLIAAPFALHNRPLGAMMSFLALFGFWEVWNGFAKKPFLDFYESQRLNCAMRALHELGTGGVDGYPLGCQVEALKLTAGFFWRRVLVSLVTEGPVKTAGSFDQAYQQARFADHNGLLSPPEAPVAETSLDREARNKAAVFWSTLVTNCGGSSYLVERAHEGVLLILEMRGAVSLVLKPEELSESDRLNGVEWRGHSIMSGPRLSRMRNVDAVPDEFNRPRPQLRTKVVTPSDWGPWQDSGPHELSLSLEKRSGTWSFHLMGDAPETDRYLRKRVSCPAMTGAKAGSMTLAGDFVSGEPIFVDVPNLLAEERTPWAPIPAGEKVGEARRIETYVSFDVLEHPDEDVDRLKQAVQVFPDDGSNFLQKPNYVLTKPAVQLSTPQEIRCLLAEDGNPLQAAIVYQSPRYYVVRSNEGRIGLVLQGDYAGRTRPAPRYLP
jgi:hypothetical protein